MSTRLLRCSQPLLATIAGLAMLPAQVPDRAATEAAMPGTFATEPGGFLLAIPGVADDFVLFADGQWQQRLNGTARYSAYVQRQGAVDRDLYLVLDFSGLVDPGAGNYPPAGGPVTTMLAAAYAPLGPVDPMGFWYYTQVSGTMTGLRALAGARIDVSNTGPCQIGAGANNQNVLPGLRVDLDLIIVQPSVAVTFAPTGPASLRLGFSASRDMCATHVDGQPVVSGSSDRLAFDLPGVASDYLFLPPGVFNEAQNGDAMLTGTLQRQGDYDDAWQLQLQFTGRLDPDHPAHPPTGFPVRQLLPSIYAAQGGVIDPAHWRYYTQVTGTLTGVDDNDGASVQLTSSSAFQVGLGAGQGNVLFGLSGELVANVQQQPISHLITITGHARLRTNVATSCILPAPQVLTGDAQIVDSVTDQTLVYTGTDLGFVEQAAIGPFIVGNDARNWLAGYVQVIDHETIELAIPQGLVAANYALTMLNATRISNQLSVDIQAPTSITMRTENDRSTGEPQHWVTHQGTEQGPALSLIVASLSNLPSTLPWVVNLQIGNQFTDYLIVGAGAHDPVSGACRVAAPPTSPLLAGMLVYSQAALLTNDLPLLPSNVWQTVY